MKNSIIIRDDVSSKELWIINLFPEKCDPIHIEEIVGRMQESQFSKLECQSFGEVFLSIANSDTKLIMKEDLRAWFLKRENRFDLDFRVFWKFVSHDDNEDDGVDFGEWLIAWHEIDLRKSVVYQFLFKDSEFYIMTPMVISPMFYLWDQWRGNHFTILGQFAEFFYIFGGLGLMRVALRHKVSEACDCSKMMKAISKYVKLEMQRLSAELEIEANQCEEQSDMDDYEQSEESSGIDNEQSDIRGPFLEISDGTNKSMDARNESDDTFGDTNGVKIIT